jgi:Sulfatase-modifying factor enzyme 1
MTLIDAGPFRGAKSKAVWLPAFYADVNPITSAQYARFLSATGHRPPAHWPDGGYALADDPDALHDDPVTALRWVDVCTYARWSSKALPTAAQWDRASRGREGFVAHHIQEWCLVGEGPTQRGPSAAPHGGFRCVTPTADLLALLAI